MTLIENLSREELQERLKFVVHRLGFVPDRAYMNQVPYWAGLVHSADKFGSLEKVLQGIISEDYFESIEVEIPSTYQKLVGATIAERGKTLLLNKPGTQKTISALSAIVPIQERYNGGKPIKTLVISPGYIIPSWIKETEKFVRDPGIVVITRQNREKAIERAADPEKQFVIVGYDMTFRPAIRNGDRKNSNGRNGNEENSGEFFEALKKYRSHEAALCRISELYGRKKARTLESGNHTIAQLVEFILKKEEKISQKKETGEVIKSLQRIAFSKEGQHYVIVDEFHNIIGDNALRSGAIASIAQPAKWTTLISGTGIGNKPDGLAWAAAVLGFCASPRDFRSWLNENPEQVLDKVRAFIDLYAIKPIKRLQDVE